MRVAAFVVSPDKASGTARIFPRDICVRFFNPFHNLNSVAAKRSLPCNRPYLRNFFANFRLLVTIWRQSGKGKNGGIVSPV